MGVVTDLGRKLRREKADPNVVAVGWKAVAIALVRAQGIHDGIWKVALRFGTPIGISSNIDTPSGQQLYPAMVVPVYELVLMKTDSVTDISVDAAVVNPRETVQ